MPLTSIRPSRPRPAFTFVEVLTVMVLIGIVAGWAVVRFGFEGYRMDSNVRLLQNVIIGAQQTAIQRNAPVQVMFDANEHRIRIVVDYNANGIMDAGDSVRYRSLADGAQFQIPPATLDGEPASFLTGPGRIDTGNPQQLAIRIEPNGALSGDAVVYIGSVKGKEEYLRAMTIVGATARTGFWSFSSGSWRQRDA